MGNQMGLVDAHGDLWKRLKKSTSPAFSLIRLKKSLPLYNSCCREMVSFLAEQSTNNTEIDCVDIIQRCAINILGVVGFGMDLNTFKDKNTDFKKHADNLLDVFRFTMLTFLPKVMSFFKVPIFSDKASKFIEKVVENNIKSRENEITERKDILGTLIKSHKDNPEDMTKEILSKICFHFLFDGYGSMAEAIICVLYMIAAHSEVEEGLREEIDGALEDKDDPNGDLTEDDINKLCYLDMVFKETLRIATTVPGFIPRQCTKKWKVPNSDLVIPVGTVVVIPVIGLQNDPEYWENPEEFVPERFSEDNKKKVKSGTYFPFGQGPKMCLGNNFARIETKFIIINLLRNFHLIGGEKLSKHLELDPDGFMMPNGGLKLRFKERDI